jgi:hypothetical protein
MLDSGGAPEGGGEPDARNGDSGGGSFFTSGPALIGAFATLITAITGLIVGLNQAGIIGGGDNGGSGTAASAAADGEDEGPDAGAVFRGTETDRGRVYFEGETMYVTAEERGKPLVVPGVKSDPVGDVEMSVRTRWDAGAKRYWVGLICRYVDRKTYYLFAVWSGGRYRIVKYGGAGSKPLSEGDAPTRALGEEDVIEARCEDDDPTSLTLVVNGEEVTHDDENGIERGLVGVRVGTDVDDEHVTVRFDDFVLRPL